jgi:hypothetical protein
MQWKASRRALLGALTAGLAAAAALAVSAGATGLGGDYGPDTCLDGFVWRGAVANDHVCVTPDVRTQAAQDNAQAATRRAGSGPYGPDTCVNGFVWRGAVPSDHVCVTPATRDQTSADNAAAPTRRNSIRVALGTYRPAQPPCTSDVCTRTSDDALRYRVRADRLNIGTARLVLYRLDGRYITGWVVSVRANPSAPGGYLSFPTGKLQCSGAANSYFRVIDGSSGRRSDRLYVTTGCVTL